MKRLTWPVLSCLFYVLLLAAWQVVANARWLPPMYLPGPDRVWRSLASAWDSQSLGPMLAFTVSNMLLGWLLASLAGVALGAIIGISQSARSYLDFMLEFLRPLPASAIFPVAISLIGLSTGMIVVVVAFGALWPMLLSTVQGFSSTEPRLYEVARTLKLSRWQIIRRIALPSAMPGILSGMRFGLTIALILATVGEMLTSQGGIGHWLLLSARSFRSADLFAGIAVLGALGLAGSLLLGLAERHVLRWQAHPTR
jgi:ABC-type nitrate/sulfonate/bicarbonate transport system permease component